VLRVEVDAALVRLIRSIARMEVSDAQYYPSGQRYNLRDIGMVSVTIRNADEVDGTGEVTIDGCPDTIAITPPS